MKVFVSEQADSDLLEIHAYLSARSSAAAEAVAAGIDRKITNLSRFPFIGPRRSRLADNLRCVVVLTYLIFYTVEDDVITIVRVLDGRRDIDAEFQR